MLQKKHYIRLIVAIFDAFSMPADKENISLSQKHNIFLHQLQIYKKLRTNDAQKHSKCLIYYKGNSPSLGYSLISLQPGIRMQRRNQALNLATTFLNKLIPY